MSIEILPQGAAVVLAAGAAVTDALRGRIYNKWILWGLYAAGAWLVLVGVYNLLGGDAEYARYPELGLFGESAQVNAEDAPAPWERPEGVSVMDGPAAARSTEDAEPSYLVYLVKVLTNGLVAITAGFAMWWFGLWAAGDAKLFAVLALLLPLSTYSNAYMPLFPAYVLLFNTFVAVMVILAVEMAVRLVRLAIRPSDDEADAWRKALAWLKDNAFNMLVGFVAIVFLFLVIKALRMLFRDTVLSFLPLDNKPLVYLLLFVVFHPLIRAMRHWWVMLAMALATVAWVAWIWLHPTPERGVETIVHMSTTAATLVLFYMVYTVYLNVFDFRSVKVWELEPRMIPARRTMEVLKEDGDMLAGKMGDVTADGLGPDQAESLRRWWIDRDKGPVIWVSRTIPFAPALLVGTLATVILGGYVVWT